MCVRIPKVVLYLVVYSVHSPYSYTIFHMMMRIILPGDFSNSIIFRVDR